MRVAILFLRHLGKTRTTSFLHRYSPDRSNGLDAIAGTVNCQYCPVQSAFEFENFMCG